MIDGRLGACEGSDPTGPRPGWLEVPIVAPRESERRDAYGLSLRATMRLHWGRPFCSVSDATDSERARLVVFVADHGCAGDDPAEPIDPESAMHPFAGKADRSSLELCIDLAGRYANRGGWIRGELHDLGVADATALPAWAIGNRLGSGTRDWRIEPAMDAHDLARALSIGRHIAERAKLDGAGLVIAAGGGAGSDPAGERMRQVIVDGGSLADAALARYSGLADPYRALSYIGGFEIAAVAGLCLAGAQIGMSVLVDGPAAHAGALAALMLAPDATPWVLFRNTSADAELPYGSAVSTP